MLVDHHHCRMDMLPAVALLVHPEVVLVSSCPIQKGGIGVVKSFACTCPVSQQNQVARGAPRQIPKGGQSDHAGGPAPLPPHPERSISVPTHKRLPCAYDDKHYPLAIACHILPALSHVGIGWLLFAPVHDN